MTSLLQGVDRAARPAICPSVQLGQHLCTPPKHHPVSKLPGDMLHVSWGGAVTNVTQLHFGAAGVSREIPAGAGGTYFKLDQG